MTRMGIPAALWDSEAFDRDDRRSTAYSADLCLDCDAPLSDEEIRADAIYCKICSGLSGHHG